MQPARGPTCTRESRLKLLLYLTIPPVHFNGMCCGQVLSKLETPRDVASAAQTCKLLRTSASADKLWQLLYSKHYALPSPRAELKLEHFASSAAKTTHNPTEALFR